VKIQLFLVLLLLALPAIGLVLWSNQTSLGPEPSFEGQILAYWLKEYEKDFDGTTKELGPGKGREAVRQIGTNALPFLIKWAATSTYDLRWHAAKLVGGHGHVRDHAEQRAHDMAWTGFATLGDIAEPAVPSLIKILDDKKWNSRKSAATSLGYIGPAASRAVPALRLRARDGNPEVRSCAAWALERIQRKPKEDQSNMKNPSWQAQYLPERMRRLRAACVSGSICGARRQVEPGLIS
jgi:HEAT repeat protein